MRTETTLTVDVVKARLRAYLQNGHARVERPRDLVSHICKELGYNCQNGDMLVMVRQAMGELEADGFVTLSRNGSSCSTILLRQRSGAKLGKPKARHDMALTYGEKDPLHVTLTKALKVLRRAVERAGTGTGLGIRAVLVADMGLPDAKVSSVMTYLRELELYESRQIGFHLCDLTVDTQVTQVTFAMVEQVRRQIAAKKAERTEGTVSPETEPDAGPATEAQEERDHVKDLADLVEAQGRALVQQEEKITAQATTISECRATIGTQNLRIAALNGRNGELERELQVAHDRIASLEQDERDRAKRAQEVLDRYTK